MEEPIRIEQKESIKLIKNTKGYQWEIKILANDLIVDSETVKRLEEINKELEGKFGKK